MGNGYNGPLPNNPFYGGLNNGTAAYAGNANNFIDEPARQLPAASPTTLQWQAPGISCQLEPKCRPRSRHQHRLKRRSGYRRRRNHHNLRWRMVGIPTCCSRTGHDGDGDLGCVFGLPTLAFAAGEDASSSRPAVCLARPHCRSIDVLRLPSSQGWCGYDVWRKLGIVQCGDIKGNVACLAPMCR